MAYSTSHTHTHTMAIALYRFSDETLLENKAWRDANAPLGCHYASPNTLRNVLIEGQPIVVLEMNLTKDKICGIGLIFNHANVSDKSIYSSPRYANFNYVYTGTHRIDATQFNTQELYVIDYFERKLFYGKSNLKRGNSLHFMNPPLSNPLRLRFFVHMFLSRFPELAYLETLLQ